MRNHAGKNLRNQQRVPRKSPLFPYYLIKFCLFQKHCKITVKVFYQKRQDRFDTPANIISLVGFVSSIHNSSNRCQKYRSVLKKYALSVYSALCRLHNGAIAGSSGRLPVDLVAKRCWPHLRVLGSFGCLFWRRHSVGTFSDPRNPLSNHYLLRHSTMRYFTIFLEVKILFDSVPIWIIFISFCFWLILLTGGRVRFFTTLVCALYSSSTDSVFIPTSSSIINSTSSISIPSDFSILTSSVSTNKLSETSFRGLSFGQIGRRGDGLFWNILFRQLVTNVNLMLFIF